MGTIVNKWLVQEPEDIQRCIIALHGRGVEAEMMVDLCKAIDIPDTLVVALQSKFAGWYPMPNGAGNQTQAIKGLKHSSLEIHDTIKKIKRCWDLKAEQICILGFSAGAVLALNVATSAKIHFNSVVALAGAIFEPDNLPKAKINTKILLQHNKDDDCFEWNERFVPMHKALCDKGYNITTAINEEGGHNSFKWHIVADIRSFLVKSFDIKEQISELDDEEEQAHEANSDPAPETSV